MAAPPGLFADLAARLNPDRPSRSLARRMLRAAEAAPGAAPGALEAPCIPVRERGPFKLRPNRRYSLLEVLARHFPGLAARALRLGADPRRLPDGGAELLDAVNSTFYWRGAAFQARACGLLAALERAGVCLDLPWRDGSGFTSLLSRAIDNYPRGRALFCFLLPRVALVAWEGGDVLTAAEDLAAPDRPGALRALRRERAQRLRWSPLRAAWVGAVVRPR